MSSALIGLIGVVVGAVLSGGFQWLRDRRASALERTIAARLLMSELGDMQMRARFAVARGVWWPDPHETVRWDQHATSLATVPVFEWLDILAAYDVMATAERSRVKFGGPLMPIPPAIAADLERVLLARLERAISILQPFAVFLEWWQVRDRIVLRRETAAARADRLAAGPPPRWTEPTPPAADASDMDET